MRIGIVSDTHDKVLAALHDALAGVDGVLHAGDVVSAEALAEIESIGHVTAVRGNMDERALADRLPEEEVLTRGGLRIALVPHPRAGVGAPERRPLLQPRHRGRHRRTSYMRLLSIEGSEFTIEHVALG